MKLLEVIAENVPGSSLAPAPQEPTLLEIIADRPEIAPLALRKVDGLWELAPVMQNTEIGLLALSNLPNGQKACRELAGRVAFGKVLAEMLNGGDMAIDDIPGVAQRSMEGAGVGHRGGYDSAERLSIDVDALEVGC